MPVLNGLELIRVLNFGFFAEKPPIIFLADCLTDDLQAEIQKAGVSAMVEFPFSLEELNGMINKVLKISPSRQHQTIPLGTRVALLCLATVLTMWGLGMDLGHAFKAEKSERAGWIEKARIFPGNLVMNAKLDTGAESASIHAENVKRFERDGEHWVKFIVIDDTGTQKTLTRKIHRIVQIKRHNAEPAKRPVVLMDICIGNIRKTAEVNLADRENYEYSLLIGRMFLANNFIIDPSSKHLLQSKCHDSPSQ